MTEAAKKYTLAAQNIQAYLCELGIKPTEEVSIFSIEYYFDKQTVSTDKNKVEKLRERCDRYEKVLTEMKNAFGGATFIDTENKFHSVSEYVNDALAAIGGDDE